MVKLARCMFEVIVDEYGADVILDRLADPLWFQGLACVLGFDWDSSGATTVTVAALRQALNRAELGLKVVGGKGKAALATIDTLDEIGDSLGLSHRTIEDLKRISRLSAKVDTCLLQDGYSIYHHAMFISSDAKWTIIQQGMNPSERLARRYHWSWRINNHVIEPHSGIQGVKIHEKVLNLTSQKSSQVHRAIVDLVKEKPTSMKRLIMSLRGQSSLARWIGLDDRPIAYRLREVSINWQALERAYEIQPKNMEELLLVRGIGPGTLRALALVAELIYGCELDWQDPLRYAYAFGGKDGVPYPVNRERMDFVIEFLKDAIENAKLGDKERLLALRRLKGLVKKLGHAYYLVRLA